MELKDLVSKYPDIVVLTWYEGYIAHIHTGGFCVEVSRILGNAELENYYRENCKNYNFPDTPTDGFFAVVARHNKVIVNLIYTKDTIKRKCSFANHIDGLITNLVQNISMFVLHPESPVNKQSNYIN